VRAGDWTVAPIPAPLRDRRVEITGPVDRKMIINGLNSGANVFMADFEDSNAPTWANLIVGQQNLRDAVAGTISLDDPARGRQYRLKPNPAVLIVRPRGWHLDEAHVRVDGAPMSASLFDFGLYFFHNATTQAAQGKGPYFYLPKIENHLEARLWRDVIAHAERACGIVAGTTRVTVLIETILAVFEMDEILFELRDVIAGLNCGRWDYIFSTIKKLRNRADFVFPDRALVTMESPALRAYSRLLIRTCHRRGALAMGGMAAQIPIRADAAANDAALAKVRTDKEREARDGHDGTWVAHPDLVPVARAVFDREMPTPNQVGRELPAMTIGQRDLLGVPAGAITEQGLRHNIRVGVQYLEAWLRGVGCVPLYNLMEDAATAEISRAQVWQWLKHGARLDDGRAVTADLVEHAFAEEIAALAASRPEATRLDDAAAVFRDVALADQFEDFLTVPAYRRLLALE
ncbi:MAG: malate synthase A, partial [Rhodospirillaceae bacterium]|nr:malate synthase A [Rhodospirillaceae bacterium]